MEKVDYRARIARLQERLRERDLHAAMIYDRENLIYFTGADDLEGGAVAIPAEGEPEMFCLFLEAEHVRSLSGLDRVTPYWFPRDTQSTMMGKWLAERGWTAPRLGFTRYFVSLEDYQRLREAAPDLEVCDIAALCYQLRSVKDERELALMRAAGRAVAAGMQAAVEAVQPGMTELEVLAEAERAMSRAGSQGAPFRLQVLTGERQLLHHPYASQARIADDGPVVIHLGASCCGYTAKMCRTVFLGRPREESLQVYEVLKEARQAAVDALRPGATCGEVYEAAADCVRRHGLERGWRMERIGYGVGIRQSEFYPVIAKDSPVRLEENMAVGLLLPTLFLPDGGPRITDVVRVGRDGPEYLTEFPAGPVCK